MSLLLLAALAAAPDPALLSRIAERTTQLEEFQKNASLRLDITADELDDSGQPKHTEVYRYRVHHKDGVASRELLAHTDDGKDVKGTEKEEERPKKRREGKQSLAEVSPFHAHEQEKYVFTVLPPRADAPQLLHLGFEPKGDKSDELFSGDATVDAATGDLLSMAARPSKLPFLVEFLTIDAELKAETPRGRAMSKMVMKGKAGLPLFKKRFRVVMEFSDYAQP